MKTKTNQLDQTSDWREEFDKLFSTGFGVKGVDWFESNRFDGPNGEGKTVCQLKNFIQFILDQQEQRHQREMEEIKKQIDYSRAHHEVVLQCWEDETKDVFKTKREVRVFLNALDEFDRLIDQISQSINKQK